MTVDAPSHVIPFSPQKIRRTKVHLYLVRSLKADRSIHVMVHAGSVDPHKGVWQANTVVGEEERAGAKLVAAADDVPRRNLKMSGESSSWRVYCVVPTPVGIFEELS
jgi:hypothetical protein